METREFIFLALVFLSLQLFLSTSHLLKSSIVSICRRIVFEKIWYFINPTSPMEGQNTNIEKSTHALFESCSDYVECTIEKAFIITTSISIVLIVIYKIIQANILQALFIIPIVIFVGYLSQTILSNDLKNAKQKLDMGRVDLIRWFRSYCSLFRECYFNWNHPKRKKYFDLWFKDAIYDIKNTHTTLQKLSIFRGVINTLSTDLPFILGMLWVLYNVMTNTMTPVDGIIWIGLLDSLLASSLSLSTLKEHHIRASNAYGFIQNLSLEITKKRQSEHIENESCFPIKETNRFRLSSGEYIHLSSAYGIHHLKAKNGSGKTSLLNAISGISDQFYDWPKEELLSLKYHYKSNIRIIKKDCTLIRISTGDVFVSTGT